MCAEHAESGDGGPVCEACGRPFGDHAVPVNSLENFPRFSGYTGRAVFDGVPFVGLRCPGGG